MAKKFNIHDWQAKQRLVEQEDFTPDLEDDELKRGAIQQMMDKEKESSWKPSNFNIKSNIEKTWESYEIMTDDLIEFIQMQYDANGSDIIEDWNDLIRKIQEKLKSLGGDEDEDYSQMGPFAGGNPLDDFPELEEQNTLAAAGSGASFSAGDGAGYATPKAFSHMKKKKRNIYELEVPEEEPAVDDEGNPIEPETAPEDPGKRVDTASELAMKLKSLSSAIKKPAGQKGIDKTEIENLALVLDKIYKNMQNGNASGTLKKILNIIPD